jgi:hypothetical protein
MAKSTTKAGASPVKASSPSKEPDSPKKASPARGNKKKDAFSPENKYKKKPNAGAQYNEIKVVTTKGDEELFFIFRGGTDGSQDAYSLHLKKDIDDEASYTVNLCLAGGYPRRMSREENVVSLSLGKNRKGIVLNMINYASSIYIMSDI